MMSDKVQDLLNDEEFHKLTMRISSEIDDQKNLIIKSWLNDNKEELTPYIKEEKYIFEDIVNRLRKLHEIEQYRLDMKELCYVLSLVEFQAYECVVYSNKKKNLLENLINKLNKQKDILLKE